MGMFGLQYKYRERELKPKVFSNNNELLRTSIAGTAKGPCRVNKMS